MTASITSAGDVWVGTLTPGTPIPRSRLLRPIPESSSLGGSREAWARYHGGRAKATTPATSVLPTTIRMMSRRRAQTRRQKTETSITWSILLLDREPDDGNLRGHRDDIPENLPGVHVAPLGNPDEIPRLDALNALRGNHLTGQGTRNANR